MILIVLGVLVYSNSLTGPFIFDDGHGITDNPSIRKLWPIWETLVAPANSGMAGRPLVNLTFAINYAIGGYDVRGYHVVNLAIHIAAGLVLLGILRRTPGGAGIALPATALWLVHPLLTESVVYISQRTEMLMGLFLLLTLYCAIRRWHIAAVVACGLGMGCKEVMVAAPLVVVLYDYVFGVDWRSRRGLYAGLAATWLMLPLLMGGVALHSKMGEGLDHFTPWEYLKTQATVIVHYLRLCFVPYPLVVDYDDWPRAGSLVSVLPTALVVVGLLIASAWGAWKKQWWGLLGLGFFFILAPTSSVVPLGTEVAAERRMYLPLIAVVVPVVAALGNARQYIVPVLIVVAGVATFVRNADYRTAQTIWLDTVQKRPENVRALVNLAAVSERKESIGLYQRALELAPDSPEAHFNLGVNLTGEKRLDEAVVHLRRASELSPRSSRAAYQLGAVLAQAGRYQEAAVAIRRALELEPGNARAMKLLAAIEQNL
ncbi:MAG: hypothetical protein PCFJNLEI_00022 [Verrucomicrobiae bacterium]|nr:hypothetical protein [Verrucomicrobiae bacterium]